MILPALAQGLLGVATLVCGIWWLVLQVFTVAEVQRVLAWRALANFVVGLVSLGVTVVVAGPGGGRRRRPVESPSPAPPRVDAAWRPPPPLAAPCAPLCATKCGEV